MWKLNTRLYYFAKYRYWWLLVNCEVPFERCFSLKSFCLWEKQAAADKLLVLRGNLGSSLTGNKSTEMTDPDSAQRMVRVLSETSSGKALHQCVVSSKVKQWPGPSQRWECLPGLAGGSSSSGCWGDGETELESSKRSHRCMWLAHHIVWTRRKISCFCPNGDKDEREWWESWAQED